MEINANLRRIQAILRIGPAPSEDIAAETRLDLAVVILILKCSKWAHYNGKTWELYRERT